MPGDRLFRFFRRGYQDVAPGNVSTGRTRHQGRSRRAPPETRPVESTYTVNGINDLGAATTDRGTLSRQPFPGACERLSVPAQARPAPRCQPW